MKDYSEFFANLTQPSVPGTSRRGGRTRFVPTAESLGSRALLSQLNALTMPAAPPAEFTTSATPAHREDLTPDGDSGGSPGGSGTGQGSGTTGGQGGTGDAGSGGSSDHDHWRWMEKKDRVDVEG